MDPLVAGNIFADFELTFARQQSLLLCGREVRLEDWGCSQ